MHSRHKIPFPFLFPLLIATLFAPSLFAGPPAFEVGEHLRYHIRWKFVTAGYADLRVKSGTHAGTDCLIFETTARAAPFIQFFFPVNDVIVSHWDPVKRRTLKNTKELHEGRYHRSYNAVFYHQTRSATWSEIEFSGNKPEGEAPRNEDQAGVTRDLPAQFQDMLSAIYFNRSHPRPGKPGQTFSIDVYDDHQLTELKLQILRREKLTLELNDQTIRIPALVVRPFIQTSGMFRSTGDILLWISDDRRRLPLKITATVPLLGSVSVELHEH